MRRNKILFLLLLVTLLSALVFVPFAAAQEGEAAAEGETTEVAAEPAANPLTPLGINVGFLIAQIVNFLLIFLLLRFLLWGPLSNMLDQRNAKIQKGLEDAAAAANARRNAETEAEKILSAARADAAREIEAARGRGEEVAKQVVNEANQAAERIRTEARARGEEERNKQLAEMRSQVANISVAVAQRLIGDNLDGKKQSALINDFFSKTPEAAKAMRGSSVEVISAMPLSAEEQAKVKSETGAESATFTVDPNILGGLVIRSADRVVDGSVRSGLNELAARLR
ncbi:MAG: F0F1 ATP synthase subunit B [Chloroflexota bacterium]|nr:F0F1 ATP synthase subunit B [Chloroflexota bacterium]